MDETELWQLLERAKDESGGDCAEGAQLLTDWLAEREPEEIVAFESVVGRLMARSYRWDLWAAAYIINGGCSDDGFDYFRGWLIAQGKEVFYAALADPETLIGVAPEDDVANMQVECEDMLYVAYDAHERRTGRPLSTDPVPLTGEPVDPAGERWDEETVETLFPRLAAWVASLQNGSNDPAEGVVR
jgi:hypothetical protein